MGKTTYRVFGKITVGVQTLVDATSPEEARELAEDRHVASMAEHISNMHLKDDPQIRESWISGADLADHEPSVEDVLVDDEY